MSATYYSQVTPMLRWSKGGTLQQRWTNWRIDNNGYATDHSEDWRDVPPEGDSDGENGNDNAKV